MEIGMVWIVGVDLLIGMRRIEREGGKGMVEMKKKIFIKDKKE